jgi:hypothetical protein
VITTETTYITSDGRKFTDRGVAENHEATLTAENLFRLAVAKVISEVDERYSEDIDTDRVADRLLRQFVITPKP